MITLYAILTFLLGAVAGIATDFAAKRYRPEKIGFCPNTVYARTVSISSAIAAAFCGTACTAVYLKFGISIQSAIYIPVTIILIAIAETDLLCFEIPDITIALVFLLAIPNALIASSPVWERILGTFIIALPLYAVFNFSDNAMGGGDVKFAASLGALLGTYNTLLAFLLSVIIGGIFGIILMISKNHSRGDQMSFGNFIAAGAFIAMIYASDIIEFYSLLIYR